MAASRLELAALGLSAIVFVGVGLAFTLWPAPMAARIDVALETPIARNDVRAVYGGFDLGFGMFLFLCLFRAAWRLPALAATTLVFGSLLSVRCLDWLLAGGFHGITVALGATELAGLLLTGAAWYLAADDARGAHPS